MKKETITKTIKIIYVIATIALIVGSYLNLNNVEGSSIITILAVIFGGGALIIENTMLKMILKQKEEQEKKNE